MNPNQYLGIEKYCVALQQIQHSPYLFGGLMLALLKGEDRNGDVTANGPAKGGMIMYKNVLVPLDGSELAECTLSHVKNLFKEGSVKEITLLNVVKVDVPWALVGSDEMPPSRIDLQAIREPLFTASRKYLESIESRLASEGIKVRAESLEGNRPADIITEYAQQNGMDLIIIGTHGYTGLKKLFLGSVAFAVLHQSHVPVLLIRPESCRP
jgi:nucleotide-binding universal stress UspA family protein